MLAFLHTAAVHVPNLTRIVRDLVTLLEQIEGGRKSVGGIEDIGAVRDRFLALELAKGVENV